MSYYEIRNPLSSFYWPFIKTRNPLFAFLLSFIENILYVLDTRKITQYGFATLSNAFRSSQRVLFWKMDISIDITKELKNILERVHI